MSQYNTLLENINNLENQIYPVGFDISKFFLSDKESVKKLIKIKNPQMSNKDINLMVDSEEESLLKLDEEEKIYKAKNKPFNKEIKKENIQTSKKIYKNILKSYYDETKNIKQEIRVSSFLLVENSIDISKKLVNAVIQTSSTIPGVTIMMTAIPFNIPGAITLALTVVEAFMDIVTKMKDVVVLLSPLKKLEIVTDNKSLSIISSILNPVLSILSSLWSPISALIKMIKSITSALSSSLKRNRNKIFRRATRRLKKLGHLYKVNKRGDEYTVDGTTLYSYDEDDVDEVKELLDTFKISRNKVVDYNQKIGDKTFEETLDDLESQLNNVDLPTENYPIDSNDTYSKYLYDVRLPDGSVLVNITEEGLESIKENYKIEFTSSSI